jgi:glutaredoxin-like YruB-family protein
MSLPWYNLAAIGIGALIATIGGILLLIAAFRQSIVWGLVVLLAPLGNLVFTCLHWAESKSAFFASLIGTVILFAGAFTIPDVQAQLWQIAAFKGGLHPASSAPDLNTDIQNHRQQLDSLQAAFTQDGADLTRQYQALDAQRKALKPADTAAIAKFNEAAAAYQARNAARKQMQQHIATTQQELEALLDTRSRNATQAAASKKVVMYTTSHCPACKAAKQYLAQKGVPYDEVDVETSRDGAQAFQKLGGRGVPLILVGDKKMEGFSPQALDALL